MAKLVKLTSKNQVTLPGRVIREFPGVEYFDVAVQGGTIVLRPVTVTSPGERLEKVRRRIAELGLTEADVAAALRWARRGRR